MDKSISCKQKKAPELGETLGANTVLCCAGYTIR